MAFLDVADKDGDRRLTQDELLNGLADGLEQQQLPMGLESEQEGDESNVEPEQEGDDNALAAADTGGLLETDAEVHGEDLLRDARRESDSDSDVKGGQDRSTRDIQSMYASCLFFLCLLPICCCCCCCCLLL